MKRQTQTETGHAVSCDCITVLTREGTLQTKQNNCAEGGFA